jgi:hypothetical protein
MVGIPGALHYLLSEPTYVMALCAVTAVTFLVIQCSVIRVPGRVMLNRIIANMASSMMLSLFLIRSWPSYFYIAVIGVSLNLYFCD